MISFASPLMLPSDNDVDGYRDSIGVLIIDEAHVDLRQLTNSSSALVWSMVQAIAHTKVIKPCER